MEAFWRAVAELVIFLEVIWQTILFIGFLLCLGVLIYRGVKTIFHFFRAALAKQDYERLIEEANNEAERWYSVYNHACNELEEKEEELRKTEDELFDLQQAYSELGQAYNELRDKLLENGIDPDCPI